MSISALRNQNSLDKLLQQVQKDESPSTEKKSYVDERLWKPQVDKAGNGYAVLRFLPAPEGEEMKKHVQQVLGNRDEARKIYDMLFENKVIEHVKSVVKIDEKEVSFEEFSKLASNK